MEMHRSQPKGFSFANMQTVRGPLSSNIYLVAIGYLATRRKNCKTATLRPRCTPSSVGWTYSGQHSSMNLAKQKKASNSEGMVYRNGAASTFIPWTYVKPSCWVSCLSTGANHPSVASHWGSRTHHDCATQKRPTDGRAYLLVPVP